MAPSSPDVPTDPFAHHRKRSANGRIALTLSAIFHLLLLATGVFNFLIARPLDPETSAFKADIVPVAPAKKPIRRVPPRVKPLVTFQRAVAPTAIYQKIPMTTAEIPTLRDEVALASSPPVLGLGLVLHTATVAPKVLSARDLDIGRASSLTIVPPAPRMEIAALDTRIETLNLRVETPEIASPTLIPAETERPPRFRQRIVPDYPETARRAGREGLVILQADVHPDGTAQNIAVVQSLGLGCDEAAISALKSSRFFPAVKGERPAIARIQVPYRFRIGDI